MPGSLPDTLSCEDAASRPVMGRLRMLQFRMHVSNVCSREELKDFGVLLAYLSRRLLPQRQHRPLCTFEHPCC